MAIRTFCLLLSLWLLVQAASGATVYVGTGQAYGSLKVAVDALPSWGDGNDTILLRDEIYFETARCLVQPKNRGRLTIRGTTGNHPIFVMFAANFHNSSTNRSLLRIDGCGTTILDGLTIIGDPSTDILLAEGAIDVDLNAQTPANPDQFNCTIIRNCLFTANDGTNKPLYDWNITPQKGRIDQYIRRGSDTLRGGVDLQIDNCTFAYGTRGAGNKRGVITQQTRATTLLPTSFQTTQSLAIRHCLFIKNVLQSDYFAVHLGEQREVRTGGQMLGLPNVMIQDNAFIHYSPGTVIRIDRANEVNLANVLIRKCISLDVFSSRFFSSAGADSGSVYQLKQLTLYHPNGKIIETSGAWGSVQFTLSDIIAAGGVAGISYLYNDDNVAPLPTALTLSAIAASPACATVSSTAAQNAFAALYQGNGSLQASPQFVTTVPEPALNGRIGWDSTDNTLLDVGNTEFLGKGTPGLQPNNALTGGAEFGTIPSSGGTTLDAFTSNTLSSSWSVPGSSSAGTLLTDLTSYPGELALSANVQTGKNTSFNIIRTGLTWPVGRTLSVKMRMLGVPQANIADDSVWGGLLIASQTNLADAVGLFVLNDTALSRLTLDTTYRIPNLYQTNQRIELLIQRTAQNSFRAAYRINDGPVVSHGNTFYIPAASRDKFGTVCALHLRYDERNGKAMGKVLYDQLALLDNVTFPTEQDAPITVEGWEGRIPDEVTPDGGLPPVAGVHNIQVLRATADVPALADDYGWTYHHHLDLGYWQGRYYLVWNSEAPNDSGPQIRLLYSTSADGFTWSKPQDFYPIDSAVSIRMYFYKAPNGRMLGLARYLRNESGVLSGSKALIAREIYTNHALGPIYTVLTNGEPIYPALYTTSGDAGFVAACQALINNKPVLEQQDNGMLVGAGRSMVWHDAIYWPECILGNENDFIFGKAFCFYHRLDGKLMGICKQGWVTLSADEGENWTMPLRSPSLIASSGKVWAQRTGDGKFAMAWHPDLLVRYPLLLAHGEDGVRYRDFGVVHADMNAQRYDERPDHDNKDLGAQYMRGVSEWASDAAPASDAMWMAYSVHKEDIWISRIPLPVSLKYNTTLTETFESTPIGYYAPGWNIYSPAWARASIIQEPNAANANRCLQLADGDPYDYARAVHVLPESEVLDIRFRVKPMQTTGGRLEIEVQAKDGRRPVRLVFNDQQQLTALDNAKSTVLTTYQANQWLKLRLRVDAGPNRYSVWLNDTLVLNNGAFAGVSPDTLQRISFRTGTHRGTVQRQFVTRGSDVPLTIAAKFLIDDVYAGPNSGVESISYE